MQQTQLLDSHSELFVREFSNDHEEAITLIGVDSIEDDVIETPYGSNPDSIRYHTRNITLHSFSVTGFIFRHPAGATISAQFPKPVLAFERTLEEDGEAIDGNAYYSEVEKAIVAQCGNVSGLTAVNLF